MTVMQILFLRHCSFFKEQFLPQDHWLPIQQRIQYKILSAINVSRALLRLMSVTACLQLYTPSRTLRSAFDSLSLQIPRTRLSTVGSRLFSVFGHSEWNDLLPLRLKPSLDSVEQLQRNVITYTTTHKEQLKRQALSTHSLHLV